MPVNENKVYAGYQDEQGKEQLRGVEVDAAGWMILDTIYHEDTHGVQLDEERMQRYDTYIEPATLWSLYRIQPCEAEAFRKGQKSTLDTIRKVSEETGIYSTDMEKYMDYVEYNSYERALEEAKQFCMDENVEVTLQEVITAKEQENGIANTGMGHIIINRLYEQQEQKRMNEQYEEKNMQQEQTDIMDMFEGIERTKETQQNVEMEISNQSWMEFV